MKSVVDAVKDMKYSKMDGLLARPTHLAMVALSVGMPAFQWHFMALTEGSIRNQCLLGLRWRPMPT